MKRAGLRFDASARSPAEFPRIPANRAIGEDWPIGRLNENLIKIGARLVSHRRYAAFRMAEVAIPRHLFADAPRLIAKRRPPCATSAA